MLNFPITRLFTHYSLILLLGFSICNIQALQPTLANLNTMVLTPAPSDIPPLRSITIGNLFTLINKHQAPATGLLTTPLHTPYPFWTFSKGIPTGQTGTIFIHSAPNDKPWQRMKEGRHGHSMLCSNAWLKNSIIQAPWVTFDYFYHRDGFDFGQGINVDCLKTVYTQLAAQNPEASYVIAGPCIGAKVALEFLTLHKPANLKALVLESPFADVEKVLKNWGKNYVTHPLVSWIPSKNTLIKALFKTYYPKFKKTRNSPLLTRLSTIPVDLPILIAHLWNDAFCTNDDMYEIVNALRASGNQHIYLLVIKDGALTHGRLSNNRPEFAQTTSAFLKKYDLPHNAVLAAPGETLLQQAYLNAQNKPVDWQIAQ